MTTIFKDAKEINSSFANILSSLSSKESVIISRRIGLNGEKETLQDIGNDFNITRERVRQIEEAGIRKIGRIIRTTGFAKIQEMGEAILRLNGGLMTKDRLVSAIADELKVDQTVNLGIIEVILQANFNINKSKPQLGTKTYFYFPEISKKLINECHKEAVKILKKKGDIMERNSLYEMVKINLFANFGKIDVVLLDSILDVYTDLIKGEETFIGLSKWKILNPGTLKEKAIYVMKKEKRPLHFVELSNLVSNYFNEAVKIATIHNELIRNNEFVLIGRGIYVLAEWGFKPGTVLDVITDVLGKAKGPMVTEEIIAKVLKIRQVKRTTIYMNLQNRQYIERVGRNLYQLKKSA